MWSNNPAIYMAESLSNFNSRTRITPDMRFVQ